MGTLKRVTSARGAPEWSMGKNQKVADLRCPDCGSIEHRKDVIDSRVPTDGAHVRRRRECSACGHRFTTVEIPESELGRERRRIQAGLVDQLQELVTRMREALEPRDQVIDQPPPEPGPEPVPPELPRAA